MSNAKIGRGVLNGSVMMVLISYDSLSLKLRNGQRVSARDKQRPAHYRLFYWVINCRER